MDKLEFIEETSDANSTDKVFNIIGIIVCIMLIPVLVINVTLLVKSGTSEEVPNFGGYIPQIVLSDSMYPTIEAGDIIISKLYDGDEVKEGDVISFFEPESNNIIVTHRVIEVTNDENGNIAWRTQGDNNNVADNYVIPQENLVGLYTDLRFAGLGNVAMFMQTTTGLIVCVVLPLLLLLSYDFIRRRNYEKVNEKDKEALLLELERLKAAQRKDKSK